MLDQDWQPIDTAPDDFKRPGGQRRILVRDRDGIEYRAKRTLWNNSGWIEAHTNRELRPFEWLPSSLTLDEEPHTGGRACP